MTADQTTLTEAGLDALLDFLGAVSGDSVESYHRLRRRLVKVLEVRVAEYRLRAAPEDLADEAIYRVAGKLEHGLEIRAKDPFKYFYGVARRVLQEATRKEIKDGVSLEDGVPELPAPVPEPPDENRHRCLDECLGALAGDERELILQFYGVDRGKQRILHRRQLAARLDLTVNALRIRAHRLRHKRLGPCIFECLKRDRGGNVETK